jgi:hypothetical protein
MPEIPREVIEHKLGIDPSYKPIKQKERKYTPERREIIQQEVNKLLEARYLVEVRRMEKFFDGFEVWYVPYLDNRDADHLACIASFRAPTPLDVVIEKLIKPLVRPVEEAIDAAKPDLMVIDEPN